MDRYPLTDLRKRQTGQQDQEHSTHYMTGYPSTMPTYLSDQDFLGMAVAPEESISGHNAGLGFSSPTTRSSLTLGQSRYTPQHSQVSELSGKVSALETGDMSTEYGRYDDSSFGIDFARNLKKRGAEVAFDMASDHGSVSHKQRSAQNASSPEGIFGDFRQPQEQSYLLNGDGAWAHQENVTSVSRELHNARQDSTFTLIDDSTIAPPTFECMPDARDIVNHHSKRHCGKPCVNDLGVNALKSPIVDVSDYGKAHHMVSIHESEKDMEYLPIHNVGSMPTNRSPEVGYEEPWHPYKMGSNRPSIPGLCVKAPGDISNIPPSYYRGYSGWGLARQAITESDDTIDEPAGDDPVGPPQGCSYSQKPTRKLNMDELGKWKKARRRNSGTCWPCKLARRECDMDEREGLCTNCERMSAPLRTIPCGPMSLKDQSIQFLPESFTAIYQPDSLKSFVEAGVKGWTGNRFDIQLTFGWGPHIDFSVEEAVPKGKSLLYQNQYRLHPGTAKWSPVVVSSPAIGITFFDTAEIESRIKNFINTVVEEHFEGFPEQCFQARDNKIQRELLNAFYCCYAREKTPLVRNSLQLVVFTFIMTHAWTIREATLPHVYMILRHRPVEPYSAQTSPRLFNRQLKSYMTLIHRCQIALVLDGYSKQLPPSDTNLRHWAPSLIALLVLCMTSESLQASMRCKEETEKSQGILAEDDDGVKMDIENLDETIALLTELFARKHHRKTKEKSAFNPIASAVDEQKLTDSIPRDLARRLKSIIKNHRQELESAAELGPPVDASDARSSRLLAKVLLSFGAVS